MSPDAPPAPAWLDRAEYPFTSRWFTLPRDGVHPGAAGRRLHYIDEGSGRPVVFVHGNPAWSFLFRNVIQRLGPGRRSVAPDHLGFGLSDKPADFSYFPEDHARNFAALMDALDLTDVTLVVGDWGGPIGLSWALDHPERVSSLVIDNTWMWSVRSDWYYQGFSGFMGGPIGRWLIRTRNYFVTGVMPTAYGDRSRLTAAIHRHYQEPLAAPEDRRGSWVFPGRIIGSSAWLSSLWERRQALADKRVALVWGMKDIAFRKKELRRWQGLFPSARVVELADVGHFVPEEAPDAVADAIRAS